MLEDIHTTVRQLLFERGRLPADEVDVRFELPTREWVDSLMRPTVNFYLFEIAENMDVRQATMQQVRTGSRMAMRLPPRRFDLRYLVSVLTSEATDQYLLVWRVLAALLRYAPLPADLMPEPLRTLDTALTTKVGKPDDGPRLLDLWGALELPPRPALLYTITAPLDLDVAFEEPLVLTRATRYTRPSPEELEGEALDPERMVRFGGRISIGGTVRDAAGRPLADVLVAVEGSAAEGSLTDGEGRFVLHNIAPGKRRLRVGADASLRVITVTVPSDSYDLTLD